MRKFFLFILLLLIPFFASAETIVVEEILAHVGNDIITKSDFNKEERRLYEELSKRFQGEELQQQFAQQRRALLEFMINQKLLDQKAAEMNLNVEEEINAAVQRLRQENNFETNEALEEALKKEGTSMAQLREDFRKAVIQQKILWNYVQGKVNITEEEIKNYYEQHKDELKTQASVKIRRYVISADSVDKQELKSEADNVLASLRSGAEVKTGDTPHLVVEESAEFSESEIDPKITNLLANLQPNSYTEPVEISNGWLLLKLEERKEAQSLPFEEVRGRIYNLLLQERAEKYQKTFLDDLRKQSYVVVKRAV